MTTNYTDPHEMRYRKTGRALLILWLLYVPIVAVVGFGLNKLLNSDWPLAIVALVCMAWIVILTVQRFTAYYRWRGRYPFYWLRRK